MLIAVIAVCTVLILVAFAKIADSDAGLPERVPDPQAVADEHVAAASLAYTRELEQKTLAELTYSELGRMESHFAEMGEAVKAQACRLEMTLRDLRRTQELGTQDQAY